MAAKECRWAELALGLALEAGSWPGGESGLDSERRHFMMSSQLEVLSRRLMSCRRVWTLWLGCIMKTNMRLGWPS